MPNPFVLAHRPGLSPEALRDLTRWATAHKVTLVSTQVEEPPTDHTEALVAIVAAVEQHATVMEQQTVAMKALEAWAKEATENITDLEEQVSDLRELVTPTVT